MSERRSAVSRQRLKDRNGASGLFREHFALAASAVLVLLSVVRVYYFAGLNQDVALGVLSVANRTQVLVSTLLTVIVTVAPFMFLVRPLRQWLLAGHRTGSSVSAKLRTGILWVPLSPIVLSTMSFSLVAGYSVGGGILWISNRRKRMKLKDHPEAASKPSPFLEDRQWLEATILGCILIGTLSSPWQPLERVTLQSADSAVVGYVVGEQGDRTLLLDKLRKPTWAKSEDITNREMCAREESWMNSSLTTLVTNLLDRERGADCS